MSDDPKAAFEVENKPLWTRLGRISALGLGYRVVDGRTIQVTTRKAVAARFELEFYPLGKLSPRAAATALMERIKGRRRRPPGATPAGRGGFSIPPRVV